MLINAEESTLTCRAASRGVDFLSARVAAVFIRRLSLCDRAMFDLSPFIREFPFPVNWKFTIGGLCAFLAVIVSAR